LTARGNQLWTQNSHEVGDVAEQGDLLGYTLAAGDFGNGQRTDLAASALGETNKQGSITGAVHVLNGSKSGLTGKGSQIWTQDSPGVPDEAEPRDDFGHTLAAR
jgi:hypothetical protein